MGRRLGIWYAGILAAALAQPLMAQNQAATSSPKTPAEGGQKTAAESAKPELVHFSIDGATEDEKAALSDPLKAASLSEQAARAKKPSPQDLFASARADYERLLSILYDRGYYSGAISIRIDGKEAAGILPMDAPEKIGRVDIRVVPGPKFHFSRATIAPLAPKTTISPEYAKGKDARTGVIISAAQAGVSGWKEEGHAKAKVGAQTIVADHRSATVFSDITLDPGPLVHFGTLHTAGNQRLRTDRLVAIAGFPTGKRFTPERVNKVQTRLRRTGIFSSVTLREADKLGPDATLDYNLDVVENKLRRMGAGAEIASSDGITLNGYWMHRNLWGGGEKLRVDAESSGIGGQNNKPDYSLGVRLDRPATISPDTSSYVLGKVFKDTEEDYTEWGATTGVGLTHIFSDRLTGESGTAYVWSKVSDDYGHTIFRQIAFPNTLTWDNRDSPGDATRGYYGMVKATPFYGLGSTTDSGMQLIGDFRTYKGVGKDNRVVFAGRAQIGGVFGSSLGKTPRSYLFYSGGSGTVRGQPYQSLGVKELEDGQLKTGGTRFIGLSGEARVGITQSIGMVAFYDAGYVSASDYFGEGGEWQSGAGLGLRYKTPIGPIRLDIAAPVSGNTGEGIQLYLGIGQAF